MLECEVDAQDLASNLSVGVGGAESTGHDLSGEHDGGTKEESFTTSPSLDKVKTGEGGDDVDCSRGESVKVPSLGVAKGNVPAARMTWMR